MPPLHPLCCAAAEKRWPVRDGPVRCRAAMRRLQVLAAAGLHQWSCDYTGGHHSPP